MSAAAGRTVCDEWTAEWTALWTALAVRSRTRTQIC